MSHVFDAGSVFSGEFDDNSGGLIDVQAGATINGTEKLLNLTGDTPFNVVINGTVSGTQTLWGLMVGESDNPAHSKIAIGAGGVVSAALGFSGIGIGLFHATDINNAGLVSGMNDGIYIGTSAHDTARYSILNQASGRIVSGNYGIEADGDGALTLRNAGTIYGSLAAIKTAGATNITNSGEISGAIELGSHNDRVINTGTITGEVQLGYGDDSFTGGGSTERVHDSGGADRYDLGGGNDTFFAASGGTLFGDKTDMVRGGAGFDTYDASASESAVVMRLGQHSVFEINGDIGVGHDNVSGFEAYIGTAFNDFIFGSNTAEQLSGGGGDDDIGGGGGLDLLTGGSGNDTFYFVSAHDSGPSITTRDAITDFEGAGAAGGDLLYLGFDADSRHSGHQSFEWHGMTSQFSHTAGDLHAFWQDGHTIVEGDTNGDGRADFSIDLFGQLTLSADDFIFQVA